MALNKIARLILVLSLIQYAVSINPSNLSLKQVQVIFRHGARTPYTVLPPGAKDQAIWYCRFTGLSAPNTNPEDRFVATPRLYRQKYIANREILPGNCTQGQLTAQGYQMHVELGAKLRQQYIDNLKFLSPTLDLSEIYVRSTDVPRTIHSVESHLLGFYPPENRPTAQIIDIETLEAASETMVPNNRCPTMMNMCNQVQQTPAWINKLQSIQPFQNHLESKWNASSLPWWIGLWDAFESRAAHQIPLPPGITQSTVDEVLSIALWQFVHVYQPKDICKLGIGTFVGEVLQKMNDSVNGKQTPKWSIYSGHDMTLALFLSAFGAFENTGYWPPYAGHLVIELLQDNTSGSYYVKFIYNEEELLIPGCQSVYCSFSTFQQLASMVIPTDWSKECGLTKGMMKGPLYHESRIGDAANPITAFLC